jgi:heterodisulfide reductase subunit C
MTADERSNSEPRCPAVVVGAGHAADPRHVVPGLSRAAWWTERQQPAGWRCMNCHPPTHLAPERVEIVGP